MNYRIGALSAIANIAIILDTNVVNHFPLFLASVFKCLEDPDNKVRYYTSEALYNIANAACLKILPHLDQFIYAAYQLSADDDTDVKKISFLSIYYLFL